MTLIGYLPSIEASFTFTDNSGTATQWGYQFVGYIQKSGGSSKQRVPQGRVDASTLTSGSSQTIRFPAVTPGTSYDGFVTLADGQGNETAQVALFTGYAVPKVQSGSPVGPIWGIGHFLGDTSGDITTAIVDGGLKRFLHSAMSTGAQALGDPSGNLLGSDFPGQTVHQTVGTYKGWEQITATNTAFNGSGTLVYAADVKGAPLNSTMLWSEWTILQATTTNNVGVGFTDADGTGMLGVNIGSGAGNAIVTTGSTKTWSSGGSISSNNVNNGLPHTVRVAAQYISGSDPTATWHIIVYIDGAKVFDNDVTANFNNANAYPAIFSSGSPNTLYARDFKFWVGVDSHEKLPASVTGNFDSSGNLKTSAGLKTYVPNSLANMLSDIGVSYSSTTTSVSIWITNAAGSGLPSWTYPDGSGSINPPAAACGSSSTPYDGLSGMTSGQTAYFVIRYNIASQTFSTIYKGTSPPTDAEQAQAVSDGSLIVVLASQNSSSGFIANGGGGTKTGGAGHQVL